EGVSREDSAAGGKGVWGRLLAKILDNIQITVKNIHIRYEDELSLDEGGVGVEEGRTADPRPLSAGVTLKKLVVQTVDENWTPTYVQETSSGKGSNRSGNLFFWETGRRGAGMGDNSRGA
ncbi:unnamed protein product, partial [Laminaria digitata]